MAATAESKPLLPALVPERSMACSMVSVVRTPKMTGTPVSRAARVAPAAAWPETYSKWAVAPRMTAPRQTTASNSPEAARRLAASGNSKAPGTQATVIEASSRPWRCSAERAPSSSDFVMVSLNRLASRAMRSPLASRRPSYVGIVGSSVPGGHPRAPGQVDVLGSVAGALRSQLLERFGIGVEHEMVAELGRFRLEIVDVLHVGHRLQRHPFDDLE